MSRVLRLVLALLALLPLAASAQSSGRFELTPTVSYNFGGTLTGTDEDFFEFDLDARESEAFGLTLTSRSPRGRRSSCWRAASRPSSSSTTASSFPTRRSLTSKSATTTLAGSSSGAPGRSTRSWSSASAKVTGSFGISFIQSKTSLLNDTLLTGFRYEDYGLGKISPLGFHLGLAIDGRNNLDYPTEGYYMKFTGRLFPEIFSDPEGFYYAGFDLRSYLTPEFSSFATLALRAGGSKVFGKYPFYAGATVGGENSMRGYNDKRFSGDAALFGQAELRLFVTQINIILKSRVGINLFAETGRVYTENDNSDKWHPSYGVGLWVSYLHSMIIGSTHIAFSPERTTFYLGLGMAF